MKTTHFVIILLATLTFTSCSQESFLEVEAIPTQAISQETLNPETILISSQRSNENNQQNSTATISLRSTYDYVSIATGLYEVEFEDGYDFTDKVLRADQQLAFKDAQGNTVTLSFQVSASALNGDPVEVDFDLGTHSLAGLDLEETQNIVVEDIAIN